MTIINPEHSTISAADRRPTDSGTGPVPIPLLEPGAMPREGSFSVMNPTVADRFVIDDLVSDENGWRVGEVVRSRDVEPAATASGAEDGEDGERCGLLTPPAERRRDDVRTSAP